VVDLPTGTVTFWFTDLEVSTRLWDQEPDAMSAALARHDAILRDAVSVHGGHVVKGRGDGFHAVFATAEGAVCAAIDAQVALGSVSWEVSEALRVRIGIHSGVAELRDGDYFGSAVNRAARLEAIAHGGQILCSQPAADLARDSLPGTVELIDLGEHTLRDLSRPERIFQVSTTGLQRSFAPLRSLGAFPGNLPVQVTSFVGRRQELDELGRVLREGRLVTLTGVGGVGKTRLAQQVAADVLPGFPDGAWFVELGPVADPDAIADTIVSALNVANPSGISAEAVIIEDLRRRSLLLVLDNCEHVLDRVAQLVTVINHNCPGVVVLATSREGLAVPGERLYAVSTLPLPDENSPVETLAEADSVQLFVDRAVAARRDFWLSAENADAVGAVCRRLDGVPLALELAAARVTALHPAQIASRLDERFKLLNAGRRGAVERHQTLRATIDWSYDLLTPAEGMALNRLAVFAGGCTLDAAEAVLAADDIDPFEVVDLLTRLVEQSLVVATDVGSDQRYRLLETIRQYAAERLADTGDVDPTRARHATYYRALAAKIGPGLAGPDQPAWLETYTTELENLRQAVDWFVQQDDADAALGLVFAMYPLLLFDASQSVFDLVTLAASAPSSSHHPLGPSAQVVAAEKLVQAGDVDTGRAALASAFTSQATMATDPHPTMYLSQFRVALLLDDAAGGRAFAEAALAREDVINDPMLHPWTLNGLGAMLIYLDERDAGIAAMREALDHAHRSGNPPVISLVANALGWAIRDTEPAEARRLLDEVIELQDLTSDVSVPLARANRAILNAREGRRAEAVRDARAALNGMGPAHDGTTIYGGLGHLSIALAELDRFEEATIVYSAALKTMAAAAHPAYGWQPVAGRVKASLGDPAFEAAWARGEHIDRDGAVALVVAALDAVEAALANGD
jgi:predicted ATPase/class 3 adenylate cyclase